MTFASHSHPHEEVWNVLEGELELVIGDERRVLSAADAAIVPSGVTHSARAVARCRAIIVDHPVRASVGGVQTMEYRNSRCRRNLAPGSSRSAIALTSP